MATPEQEIAAVVSAVDAMPSADRRDGVKRFIAMFKAMMALQAPQQPQPPEATLLMSFTPTDDIRPDIERVNGEIVALLKKQLAVPPK